MSDDKPTKDEQLEQRKRELEEELEAYAQSGVSSPGLLKAARWVSRGLYFLMAGLVAFLLFSGWGKVSKQDHEAAVRRVSQLNTQLSETRTERDEHARRALRLESEVEQVRRTVQYLESGTAEADRELIQAARLLSTDDAAVVWARDWRDEARPRSALVQELAEAYRSADESERAGMLALLARVGGDEQAELMRQVATAPGRTTVERIIAIRWLGERSQDGDARRVLEALARGDGVLAAEATQALQRGG